MFLMMTRLPPAFAAVTIALAHLAVLVDIAIRRDLPWARRLVTGVIVGALLPLGALAYLLVRPVGDRMRQRIASRRAALAAKRVPAASGWRRTLMRAGSVTAVAIALLASVLASAVAQPTSPFAGEDYGVALLNLPAAWPASTGRGVTVAVVDSGVDPANPFLAPRLVPGHDFADGTGSTKDGLGHGTHVAGIVAQAAPDAHIMPVKVLDSAGHGGVSGIAAGVRWAVDHGAGVVNLSVDESGLLAQIQKEGALNDAAEYAHAKGAVVIAAAGNEHQHLQVYQSGVPVITVAAVDQNRHPASFTNWGGPAEVAAPGVDIWSTAPEYPTTLFPNGTDGSWRAEWDVHGHALRQRRCCPVAGPRSHGGSHPSGPAQHGATGGRSDRSRSRCDQRRCCPHLRQVACAPAGGARVRPALVPLGPIRPARRGHRQILMGTRPDCPPPLVCALRLLGS